MCARRSTCKLYERLTSGPALLPPAVAFIFDRELRSERDRTDLGKRSAGKVSFLPRRTYENYLLNPRAIAAVLNASPGFEVNPTSAESVAAWMEAHRSEEKYFKPSPSRDFEHDIDAPKFLKDLFYAHSNNTLEYGKTEHSVALTNWLIEHEPEALRELADLLVSKLPASEP
jgi:hypothetical protein